MENTMENKNDYNVSLPFFGIPRVVPYMKRFRKTIILMVICGLAGTCVDILMPLMQRYALDHFIANRTLDTIVWYILLYVFLTCFAAVVNYISCSKAMTVEVGVNRDLRDAAFSHLQTLSFSYYNQNSVGYIHARKI